MPSKFFLATALSPITSSTTRCLATTTCRSCTRMTRVPWKHASICKSSTGQRIGSPFSPTLTPEPSRKSQSSMPIMSGTSSRSAKGMHGPGMGTPKPMAHTRPTNAWTHSMLDTIRRKHRHMVPPKPTGPTSIITTRASPQRSMTSTGRQLLLRPGTRVSILRSQLNRQATTRPSRLESMTLRTPGSPRLPVSPMSGGHPKILTSRHTMTLPTTLQRLG
mmetsp:Transcript_21751/g.69463  ORF Transcript_21751/g.69463 Transcript_21751/m.69463 type:complete len:219 (+) Transcript_21751:551-1207(+)